MNSECKEMQKLIGAFDNRELNTKQLKQFFRHVNECAECKEEMETFYIINYALNEDYKRPKCKEYLKEFEELFDKYDFKGIVDLKLDNVQKRIKKRNAIIKIILVSAFLISIALIAAIIAYFLCFRI